MNSGKAQEKLTPFSAARPDYGQSSVLDKSLITLEDTCSRLLETRFPSNDDSERMVWQQRFRNILTNISLGLAEAEGSRRFHFHYRHDRADDSKMLPVLENPLSLLAHTCQLALQECTKKLACAHDRDLRVAQRQLESAIRSFLMRYERVVA